MRPAISYLAFLGASLTSTTAYAIFNHVPLPSAPKVTDVGEIVFNRADWSANFSEYVKMDREEFLQFFRDGIFRNDGKTQRLIYDTEHFAKPLNKQGGWRYCKGAFATKTGAVFFWNRPREGVLMISDAKYRTGWLILPKYWDAKASAFVAPKNKPPADEEDDFPLE